MQNVSIGSMRDQSARIFEQVNWTVAAGDYWVIAGLQGSGKSDFLMMTAGLMPPASGGYRLFGEPMPIYDEERLAVRLRLGFAFDGGQLFNHLTVGQNVALPLRYQQNLSAVQAQPEAHKWLEALELASFADSTPGAIGRNWQKRVGLARALMLEPEILLIDNPLGGLDLRHVNWWLGFLDQLSRGHPLLGGKKVTLVVSTGDLRRWKDRARQFAVLRDRRFVVLGDWAHLEAASDELLRELLMTESLAT